MTTGRINQVPTVGWLHTMCSNNNAIPFSVRCLAWLGSWFGEGAAGGGRYPTTPSQQASQPATHTPMYSRLFVCLLFHIYIYIYIYAPHHTDRQTSIDVCLFSLSLSLYIVLVLVACTLSHHHHHTTRAVRVYVCVCVHLAPFRAMLQTSR